MIEIKRNEEARKEAEEMRVNEKNNTKTVDSELDLSKAHFTKIIESFYRKCEKKRLDLFESLAESSQSRVTERRKKRIHGSQACSSRSAGEQIEEKRHRSQSYARAPAIEEFQFWNQKSKIETPVVLKRCFPKTSTPQMEQTIPTTRVEYYIPPNLGCKSPIFDPVEKSPILEVTTDDTEEKYIDITIEDNDGLRKSLINRCEEIVLDIVEQLCAGIMPKISYQISTIDTLMDQLESENSESIPTDKNSTPRVHVEFSSVFETPESLGTESIETENDNSIEGSLEQKRLMNFGCKRSRNIFALMITTIAKVHELLRNNTKETRRSFFYELKNNENARTIVTKQKQIDEVVNTLANLLECAPWETGLVPSAKGLAAGNMTLKLSNDREIHFTNPGGTMIPQIVSNVTAIRTKAKFVIVVEKDTVFQKLLDEDCPNRLDCIVITGKGYPDMATRMIVKILAEQMKLAVYALVDADPYGFEIMCTYKYGSISLSRWQGSLNCPSIRWLGFHPSELRSYVKIPTIPLTDADTLKYEALLNRPYVNGRFLRELRIMQKGKAEIEAIICSESSATYTLYLQMKIESGDYI